LAKAAGVNVETIRYYQRRGLIVEPSKPFGGQRRYPAKIAAQLTFIRRAQQLGFSLEEVKTLLRHEDGRGARETRALAERKLEVLDSRITEMTAMRRKLKRLVEASRTGATRDRDPIVDALSKPE
jgi:MerR family mercuric resistance operon transcriptional regulator